MLSLKRFIIWNTVSSIELNLSQSATKYLVSPSSEMLMKISQIVETTSMWGKERLHRSARLAKMHNAIPLFSISLRQQDWEYRVANSRIFNFRINQILLFYKMNITGKCLLSLYTSACYLPKSLVTLIKYAMSFDEYRKSNANIVRWYSFFSSVAASFAFRTFFRISSIRLVHVSLIFLCL